MGKKSNAKEAKKEELKEEPKKTVIEVPEESKVPIEKPESQEPEMREVIIQTDGTSIKIVKDTSAGKLELLAILQALIGSLTSPK